MSDSAPLGSRPVPARPDLDRDRKRAKTLLKAWRAGDADALALARSLHPRRDLSDPKLADAQLVVAREYDFASWPRWKAFVETRRLDRDAQADALVRAICSNNVRAADTLLAADPTLADHSLATACACGRPSTVRAKLGDSPGEAINAPTGPLDWPPLVIACHSRLLRADAGRAVSIVAVVEWLLEHGANPDAHIIETWHDPIEDESHETRLTALFGAAGVANHAGLTRMLLAAGADVDELAGEPDGTLTGLGIEALYHACEFRDLACVRLLLEAGPHPMRISYCLSRMLDFDHPEGAALFLEHGANPSLRVAWHQNRSHLHKAVINGRAEETVRALIEAGADINAVDDDGCTPLDLAEQIGHTELATLLLQHGAETRRRGSGARPNPMLLCLAAKDDDIAAIDRLLATGADVEATDGAEYSIPALHWACWRGRFDAARRLIDAGADIHRVNCYGGDALGTTVHGSANCFDPEGGPAMKLPEEAYPGRYADIVDLLLDRGAKRPKAIDSGSDAVQETLRRHGVPDPS